MMMIANIAVLAETASLDMRGESNKDSNSEVSAPPSPDIPADSVLEVNGATIGNIIIVVNNVFDTDNPKENNVIFRSANALHIKTKEQAIRYQLLFRGGDLYSRRLIDESERLLRTNDYIYEAKIEIVSYKDNKVDVRVVIRDNWTIRFGASYSVEGGQSATGATVGDTNFLGLGKTLEYGTTKTSLRTQHSVRYIDPNLFGGRHRLALEYGSNSDGEDRSLGIELPFYALDTSRSYGATVVQSNTIDARYSGGVITEQYIRDENRYSVFWGRSHGLRHEHVDRWRIGISLTEERYYQLNAASTVQLPLDSNLAYPWLEYEMIEDRYRKMSQVFLLNRTEDVNLGNSAVIRVGYLSEKLGGDGSGVIMNMRYGTSYSYNPDRLLFVSLGGSGLQEDDTYRDTLFSLAVRYFHPNFKNQSFYAGILVENAEYFTDEEPLWLGGEAGLRGYPLRYQHGTRKRLLTLEQRYYTPYHLFRVFHVAGVIFADVGRAWDPVLSSNPYPGVLSDVGVGLRFASSRTGGENVLHFDVAFPLDGDPSIAGVQYTLKAQSTF
ncbi:MAG: hypothetical protein OEY67_07195 [Gammaproteobacteria bacterium]|nr:hypothetical protein [Gammaproteobacteria bacterium]